MKFPSVINLNNKAIVYILFLLFISITNSSCIQDQISRKKAKKIGMKALYEKFDKEKIDDKKPYRLHQTDSTWVLSPYHHVRKGYRLRDSRRGPSVIMNKKNGEIIKIF